MEREFTVYALHESASVYHKLSYVKWWN